MPLETEIKLAMTVADIPRLLETLPPPLAVKDLRNEYFDTQDRILGARREMLRVRFREGYDKAVLCFKGPSQSQGAVFQASEHEWILDLQEALNFAEDPLKQYEQLKEFISKETLSALHCIGTMKVRRVCVAFGPGQVLEIDHVWYPDGFEDAEIELEVAQEDVLRARTVLGRLIAETGLTISDQSQTKYARFLVHGGGA